MEEASPQSEANAVAFFSEPGSVLGMTVEAIKEAIAGLADEGCHSLSIWLNGLEYDDWDKQMATDFSPGGRGARLVEKVKANVAAGRFRPVEEFCGDPKQTRK